MAHAADLWLAAGSCGNCTATTELYALASSSTSKSLNKDFSITYGTGHASGTTVEDIVTLGGYTAESQVFGPLASSCCVARS